MVLSSKKASPFPIGLYALPVLNKKKKKNASLQNDRMSESKASLDLKVER